MPLARIFACTRRERARASAATSPDRARHDEGEKRGVRVDAVEKAEREKPREKHREQPEEPVHHDRRDRLDAALSEPRERHRAHGFAAYTAREEAPEERAEKEDLHHAPARYVYVERFDELDPARDHERAIDEDGGKREKDEKGIRTLEKAEHVLEVEP